MPKDGTAVAYMKLGESGACRTVSEAKKGSKGREKDERADSFFLG